MHFSQLIGNELASCPPFLNLFKVVDKSEGSMTHHVQVSAFKAESPGRFGKPTLID